MPRHTVHECPISGTRMPFVDNELSDDEEEFDTHLPPGGAVITVRRVVANPELEEFRAEKKKALARAKKDAKAASAQAPADQAKLVMDQMVAQVEAAYSIEPAPHTVVEITEYIAPEFVPMLGLLCDSFGEMFGTPPGMQIVEATTETAT